MSTRSFIGHKIVPHRFSAGVRGIYCHYDGYPSHTGVVLNKHHNSMHKCEGLVGNGQIRRLDGDGKVDLFYTGDYEEYSSLREVLTSVYDYAYIFEDGKWNCFTYNSKLKACVPVEIPEESTVTE